MAKIIITVFSVCILFSCAGKMEYMPPAQAPTINNSVKIHKSKDEIWKKIVPALGKSFFVINNLDKESGIINISYSGDPEKYVDCGRIHSYVKNAKGERTYDFPAARSHQVYEIMDMKHGGQLFTIDRKMYLEGRINIILEEISPVETLITVNTKYVVTKSGMIRNVSGAFRRFSDTTSFVSGGRSEFAGYGTKGNSACQSNGRLEQEILSIILSGQK